MGTLASPFARKLFGALIGTVLLLALGIAWAVRRETEKQITVVSETTFARAETSLASLEQVRRDILRERMAPFVDGVRGQAALEEVARDGAESLVPELDYMRDRSEIRELLLVLHDPDGATLFGAILRAGWVGESVELPSGDPLDLLPLTDEAFEAESGLASGYRRVNDRVFRVESIVAVRRNGDVVGFYTLGSPIAQEDIEEVGRIAGVEVCFLDDDGCLVGTMAATSDLEHLFREAAGSDVGDTGMLGMFEGAAEGRWELLGSDLAGSGGLRLAYAVPLEPVLRPFERVARALGLGVVASVLLAALAAGLLARGMTAPVLRLTSATRRIGEGDFDVRVDIRSRDEIGDLGTAFNGMAEGLALKERYRGVLDKVVAPEVAAELLAGDIRLGGEAREVTVLFGDIRGFTALTGAMEPEHVIEMLNEYMAVLAAEVDRAGGVVDKFVGDEIMAIFGAPVSHGDDADRAVSAARAMQERMAELNADRDARGEPVLGLGIGINTGRAVAGNMGSPDRLNYTVLGRSVNLAARLCSGAEAGEILLGEDTKSALSDATASVESAGVRPFKGFAEPVEVFRAAVGRLASWALLAGVFGSLLGVPGGFGPGLGVEALSAQEWPSIRDRAYWTNASGSVQAGLSGRLELDGYVAGDDGPGLLSGRDLFAPRLRVFGDLFLGDHVQLLVEGRVDRGDVPGTEDLDARIERAYVRVGGGGTLLAFTLGKFPSPVGGYAERHLTTADPFIRPPVPYDQRTVASDRLFPTTLEGFLTWHENPSRFRTVGQPPLWQVPYPWGARLDIGTGDTGIHVSVLNSAPSSVPGVWDLTEKSLRHPHFAVGARTALGAEWRVAAWWARGPWLWLTERPIAGYGDLFDYAQTLLGGQLEWKRGGTLARGELWFDTWEVPFTDGTPFRDVPWSVMLQQDLAPGFYLAGRLGGMRYLEVDVPGRGRDRWDDDTLRAELGAGWRLARNAGLKATVFENWTFGEVEPEPRDGLLAIQLWWEF